MVIYKIYRCMQSTLANLIHFSNCKWTLAGGVQDGMCVSVQYDRLHVVFVVGDNLLAICIRPNGTSREAEERPQLVQIFSETTSYSRVQKSWNEVFFKILKKPSIVQKKMIPHIKGLDFSQR